MWKWQHLIHNSGGQRQEQPPLYHQSQRIPTRRSFLCWCPSLWFIRSLRTRGNLTVFLTALNGGHHKLMLEGERNRIVGVSKGTVHGQSRSLNHSVPQGPWTAQPMLETKQQNWKVSTSLRRKTANGSLFLSSLSLLEWYVDWSGEEFPPGKQSKSILVEKGGDHCAKNLKRETTSPWKRQEAACGRQLLEKTAHDPECLRPRESTRG